jgi:uncharacterized protein (DUF362 family)
MGRAVTRRELFKGLGSAGIGAALGGSMLEGLEEGRKSRVVLVREGSAMGSDGRIDGKTVRKMVDLAVARLVGKKSPEDAWKSLFSPNDIVGIKINCLFGPGIYTSPEVVDAIINGLISAGVPEEQIIVWDRSEKDMEKSGYAISRSGKGVQYIATNSPGVGYEPNRTSKGSFNGRISRILTKATAIVNVPILKDHNISGVTIAMKNHYGSISNPGDHHGNNCDPYIADLNSIPEIKDKTRLIICDAIYPLAEGGPGNRPSYRWRYCGIIASKDPVALDYVGWRIIEDRRKEIGLPELAAVGRPPKWIDTAARLGLGTNDPSKIDLVRIEGIGR